jgi:hypothetical protein
MKSKSRYNPKKLKFSGEESFMVPKEGEKFILAVGADVVAIDKQNAENIDVAPLEPVSVTNPNVVVADSQVTTPPSVVIPVPNWRSMDCASIQAEINNIEQLMITSRFTQDIRTQYENILAEGRSVYNSTCLNQIEVPPPPDGVPPAPPVITEPTWSSLSCEAVLQEIATLQNQYATGPYKLGRENYENIPTYIQNGKKYYTNNCEGKTQSSDTQTTTTTSQVGAPPITTITTTGTPIIATASTGGLGLPKGGGFGGGSGGGGGAKEEPKKGFNWWWLLLVAGGVYLLTRKK